MLEEPCAAWRNWPGRGRSGAKLRIRFPMPALAQSAGETQGSDDMPPKSGVLAQHSACFAFLSAPSDCGRARLNPWALAPDSTG
jgi:hypothetical protein